MSDFDPSKHLIDLGGQLYLEVKWRLVWFRQTHPAGRIDTEIIELSDQHAYVRATASYPIDINGQTEWALATGHGTAHRTKNSRFGHKFLERAETTAIGRALAALGFGTQYAVELSEAENELVDAPVEYGERSGATERRTKPQRANEGKPRSLGPGNGDLSSEEADWLTVIREAQTVDEAARLANEARQYFGSSQHRVVQAARERVRELRSGGTSNGSGTAIEQAQNDPDRLLTDEEKLDLLAKAEELGCGMRGLNHFARRLGVESWEELRTGHLAEVIQLMEAWAERKRQRQEAEAAAVAEGE